MKNKTALIYLIILGLISFSGIIRHDVSEKEYIKLADQSQFNCSGRIIQISDSSGGSGVLISPKHVLTAAHILINSDEKTDTVVNDGKKVVSYHHTNERTASAVDFKVKFGKNEYQGKAIYLHPDYLSSESKFDIAIIELAEEVAHIKPIKRNHNLDELHSKIVGVGFGASGIANKPQTVKLLSKKIAGQNVVDSLGGYLVNERSALMFCDFDHPTNTECCNKMGSPIPEPLEYISTGGDSGSGIFREKDNNWQLIGIVSGGGVNLKQFLKSGYYGQTMKITRVSLFNSWIEEVINN
ncbi:MAG: trypsin-like serine protease [Bacteroidales bacterium]|nr:trypsin-like serine protease [Bacteroidales bacterium]